MSDPKKILLKYSADLIQAITADVNNVASALFAKKLITQVTREYVVTAVGVFNAVKAHRVMTDVKGQLIVSLDERHYLIDVCHVLTERGGAMEEIGNVMLEELGTPQRNVSETGSTGSPMEAKSPSKDLNMGTVMKIFTPSAHHYRLIGFGLDVNVADLIDTDEATNNLMLVFQRWFEARKDVNWDTLMKLCDDFPDQLGKAKANLKKIFIMGENRSNIDDLIEPGTLKKWFDDKEEGWINLTLTRVQMVGPAGSGKTCAQNLILNEPPPEHIESPSPKSVLCIFFNSLISILLTVLTIVPRLFLRLMYTSKPSTSSSSSSKSITNSTPLACKAVKALKISSDDNETWKGITRVELLERLSSRLKRAADKFYQQKQATSAPTSPTEPASEAHTCISNELEVTSKTPEKPRDYGTVVTEIVECLSEAKAKAELSEKWAYIIDSGGQPAFQELLPVFTRAATLNIITLDLSKGLDKEIEYKYRINGKEFECDEKMKYSNRKVFNSVVSAASVKKPLNIRYQKKPSQDADPKPSQDADPKPSQDADPIHSMSFVLGTHYDVIKNSKGEEEAEAEVKKMSDDLMKQLDSHSQGYVIQNVHKNSIIYPVDTLVKDPNKRRKISQELFKIISDRNETSLSVRLPIRLFIFELCLEKRAESKGGFVTRKEADDEGERLHMTSDNVKDALTYLHNCTIILYYPDIEPQLVFVDPQKIFVILSQLLALTYVDENDARSFVPEIIQEEMTTLKRRGCFKERLLAKFTVNAVFTGEFNPKYFIDLLKKCHVIAEFQTKSSQTGDAELKYFLPSALCSYNNSFQKSLPDRKPLLFVWRKQEEDDEEKVFVNVPQGIFPLMIVHLLKQKECVVRLSNPDKVTQFRDAVSLLVSFDKNDDDPDEHLYIINQEKHIEVIFNGKKEQCPKIKTLVRKVISKSASNLSISVEDPNIAFACQLDNSEYCIVSEEARKTSCHSTSTHTCTLDDSYWCWLNTSSTCSSCNWKVLGVCIAVLVIFGFLVASVYRNTVNEGVGQDHVNEGIINDKFNDGKLTEEYHKLSDISLDVTNLQEILNVLGKGLFPEHRWFDLGLSLSLIHNDLSVIETDRSTAHRRLQEMLSLWLRRGRATWNGLAAALENIEEYKAAEVVKAKVTNGKYEL